MTATAAPVAKYPKVQNYIGGKFVTAGGQTLEVLNPADGSLLSHVPLSGPPELDLAVRAAAAAFPAWSARTIKDRVQVFFRYRTLLERDAAELAELIV
jgi:malonate-semialdehyde dehydrogenase (acetylating) / methylmalonate-semialdehyde dehydrogenase